MKFKFDEYVWAKLKGYTPWPGKILFGHASDPPSKKKEYKYVYFFGSHNHAWIPIDKLYKYVPYRKEFANKHSSKAFRDAVKYVANEHRNRLKLKRDVNSGYPRSSGSEDESDIEEVKGTRRVSKRQKKILKKKFGDKAKDYTYFRGAVVLRSEANMIKIASIEVNRMERLAKRMKSRKSSLKNTAKPLSVESSAAENSKRSSTTECGIDSSILSLLTPEITVIPLNVTEPNSSRQMPELPEKNNKMRAIQDECMKNPISSHLARDLKVSTDSTNIIKKMLPSVTTIPMESSQVETLTIEEKYGRKLGFIGLGNVGRNMAKTFLRKGDSVNIWCDSPSEFGDVLKAGGCRKITPAEVIVSSDIIFCFLSDSEESRKAVFSEEGVLKGFNDVKDSRKIYVDLTTTDIEMAKNIDEAIRSSGGLFFEAAVLGSMSKTDCSSLIFLCAGDVKIFKKVKLCLESITRNIFYVGNDFGENTERNLTYYTIQGIYFSALINCSRFIQRQGYNLRDLKCVLQVMPDDESMLSAALRNVNAYFIEALNTSDDNHLITATSSSQDAPKGVQYITVEDIEEIYMEL